VIIILREVVANCKPVDDVDLHPGRPWHVLFQSGIVEPVLNQI